MLTRIPNRLKGYDYSFPGYYFVTICAKDRLPIFGNVINGEMILNDYGEIFNRCWNDLPDHYGNIILDEFVVMPEHIHGRIEIVEPESPAGTGLKSVPAGDCESSTNFVQKINPGKKNNLSEIIRGFKTFSSKNINQKMQKNNFKWQRSFYDRIIREKNEYCKIKKYIKYNPEYWFR